MDIDETTEVEMAVPVVSPGPDASPAYAQMLPYFAPFPFTPEVRDNIIARREQMSNELILDLLLEQAGVADSTSLFPPDSEEGLERLLAAIYGSEWDLLKKYALVFYLLCFVDVAAGQRATALPPHFASLAQACFLLDAGDIPSLTKAVALLSDARIVQDLAPKILQTLEVAKESRLIRMYVRTAQPVLQAFDEAAIYLRALLDQSLSEAWSFQRGFAEGSSVRNQLIRVILDACLMPPNPTHLPQLLALPLTAFESSLLQAYALSPPTELTPTANAILQDLLTVRLLSAGRYSDAIRISRAFDDVDRAIRVEKGNGAETQTLVREAAERRATMRAVLNVLPAVQRRELEAEVGGIVEPAKSSTSLASLPSREHRMNGRDAEPLASSWEDLGMSTSSLAGRLEGSPAPGRVTSAVRTPRGTASMGVNILSTPMSIGSPIRKHTTVKATPPVRPARAREGAATATPMRTPNMLIPKPVPPTPGVLPQPITTVTQPTPFQSPAPTPSQSAPLTTKSALAVPTRAPGRFGLQPTPTPEPGASMSPSPQKPLPQTARDLFTGPSTSKQPTPQPLFGGKSRTASPNDQVEEEIVMEDVQMVDSDDPDAFVVHGRGRNRPSLVPAKSPSPEPELKPASEDVANQEEKNVVEETISPPSSRVLPGGFISFQQEQPPVNEEPEPPKPAVRRSARRSVSAEPAPAPASPPATRMKIPGGLNEVHEEAEEAEEPQESMETQEEPEESQEQQDEVGALPSPSKRTRRTTRRHSSVSADSGDEGGDNQRLRRSSRISQLSPESKKKIKEKEKETSSGRTTRTTGRKRKAA